MLRLFFFIFLKVKVEWYSLLKYVFVTKEKYGTKWHNYHMKEKKEEEGWKLYVIYVKRSLESKLNIEPKEERKKLRNI